MKNLVTLNFIQGIIDNENKGLYVWDENSNTESFITLETAQAIVNHFNRLAFEQKFDEIGE